MNQKFQFSTVGVYKTDKFSKDMNFESPEFWFVDNVLESLTETIWAERDDAVIGHNQITPAS